MYRDILICTVGTSLLGNLERTGGDLAQAARDRNATKVAKALSVYDPKEKLLGAEINSITSILHEKYLDQLGHLYFLHSETEDGSFLVKVFKQYFEQRANANRFDLVEHKVIEGLTDKEPKRFKKEGLRNLVREVAALVRRFGNNRIVINATGGYKAQISFAGMIGQALEIPVCYMFERFDEVIELPPQPISLDFSFWLEHVDQFFDLSQDEIDIDPRQEDHRFESLVEYIPVNNSGIIGLSPVGQLFHESFKHKFFRQKEQMLPPVSGLSLEEKKIKYEDDNEGKHTGLANYLEKILEKPYVKRIYTHYYNPDLPMRNTFRHSKSGDISQLEGIYSDKKKTTKFDVVTTAKNKSHRDAVIADLSSSFL